MHIKGWVPSSLLDYPGRIAASLFCGGCNFRCPNCHNGDIVVRPQDFADVPLSDIWSFLDKRHGLLDGVVVSGGEPTLESDLLPFCARLHEKGFLVKLDTNGYRPDVLQEAITGGLIDYVAMDVKAPLDPVKYTRAAGVPIDTTRIQSSVDTLLAGSVEYEFRTTVIPGIHQEEDIVQIAQAIADARLYFVQQFVPRGTLDPEMLEQVPLMPERIRGMADLASKWVDQVRVRGI